MAGTSMVSGAMATCIRAPGENDEAREHNLLPFNLDILGRGCLQCGLLDISLDQG